MSEDKIEITKAQVCPNFDETIVKQAAEFLDGHGKGEMAMDYHKETSKQETKVEDVIQIIRN